MTETKPPAKKAPAAKKPAGDTAPKAAPKSSKKDGFYAVFATGGKQYRVRAGDRLKIEKLPGTHKEGDTLTFDKVLLVDDGKSEATLGDPFINGAEVSATLTKVARHKTIDVIKYKQKSRYFKKYGHRQPYFEVKIVGIK